MFKTCSPMGKSRTSKTLSTLFSTWHKPESNRRSTPRDGGAPRRPLVAKTAEESSERRGVQDAANHTLAEGVTRRTQRTTCQTK